VFLGLSGVNVALREQVLWWGSREEAGKLDERRF
jgi:hypothetical protein